MTSYYNDLIAGDVFCFAKVNGKSEERIGGGGELRNLLPTRLKLIFTLKIRLTGNSRTGKFVTAFSVSNLS